MEKYRELELDLSNHIEDTLCLDSKFTSYRDSVNDYIDELFNIEKIKDKEIERLNNIINEAIYFLELDMVGTALDRLGRAKRK